MVDIARKCRLPFRVLDRGELAPPDLVRPDSILQTDSRISHVAVVHCETTTGMLNPVADIGRIVKSHGRIFILDAMSSFGGIPLDAADLNVDFLISSANKCLQGVPGFGFVIARRRVLDTTRDRARSLSLDLYDQWRVMEEDPGKWRFTSPTHVVWAFAKALKELEGEGWVTARFRRYSQNHRLLVEGIHDLGFDPLLQPQWQSPIITAFCSPAAAGYDFKRFYTALKQHGFVIYPGKVTDHETFDPPRPKFKTLDERKQINAKCPSMMRLIMHTGHRQSASRAWGMPSIRSGRSDASEINRPRPKHTCLFRLCDPRMELQWHPCLAEIIKKNTL